MSVTRNTQQCADYFLHLRYLIVQKDWNMRMASLPCGANRHQLAPTPDTPPPRPPQREEQRGTQRNSWGLLVCTTCFRPSIEWGWPACRRTAVHIAPLCSTSPNALLTERSSEAPSQTGGSSYRAGLYSLAWRLAIVERNTMYKNHPVRPSKCRGNSPCKMVDQWMISCLTLDINTCV